MNTQLDGDFSIDNLLAQRKTRLLGDPGSHEKALANLELSKLIASIYEGFDVLRKHLIHPDSLPQIESPSRETVSAIKLLSDIGWIKTVGRGRWQFSKSSDSKEFQYIKGGWLEEYVYCAHLEAGVDEVTYGQRVEWQVGEVIGTNEIDVVARRGNVLSFTSCKTQNPYLGNGTTAQLTGFLTEVDYWDTHFANNRGKLLLVVTTDLIDEIQNNRKRYPQALARANILNIDMVGLEQLRWESLVESITAHWVCA